MRLQRIEPRFVDFVPEQLEEAVLYLATRYRTAAHLCCCGCGTRIVTPLKPGFWALHQSDGGVSLAPSVGNWNHPCQSHYIINKNEVQWVGGMSRGAIQHGRRSDQLWLQRNYKSEHPLPITPPAVLTAPTVESNPRSWLRNLADWVKSLIR